MAANRIGIKKKWIRITSLGLLAAVMLGAVWIVLILPMPVAITEFSPESACFGSLIVSSQESGKPSLMLGNVLLRPGMPFQYMDRTKTNWLVMNIGLNHPNKGFHVVIAKEVPGKHARQVWSGYVREPVRNAVKIGPYQVVLGSLCYLFWPES